MLCKTLKVTDRTSVLSLKTVFKDVFIHLPSIYEGHSEQALSLSPGFLSEERLARLCSHGLPVKAGGESCRWRWQWRGAMLDKAIFFNTLGKKCLKACDKKINEKVFSAMEGVVKDLGCNSYRGKEKHKTDQSARLGSELGTDKLHVGQPAKTSWSPRIGARQ